jgi:hypothetical protein
MIDSVFESAYRKLGPRYPQTAVVGQIQLGYLVWLVTIAILPAYVEMSTAEFARLFLFGLVFFVMHNRLYPRIA